jgi:ATP-dependent 26S proteasome regulatory subunit
MLFKKNIYLFFLGLFSVGVIILSLIGFINSKKTIHQTLNKPSFLENKQKEIDQQMITQQTKIEKLQQQDNTFKTQIEEATQILTEIIQKMKNIQTELKDNTTLAPEIKKQKQQTIIQLQNQQQNQQALVNNLLEQRRALNQNQAEKQQELEKLAQEKAQQITQENIQQQITQFNQAINYVESNQKNIVDQKTKKENHNNKKELENLNSFNLFLEGQKIYFQKQKKNLTTKLNLLKENKTLSLTKEKVTFKDVYGMENEKEELEDLLTYFQNNQSLINFDKVRPKGYLLYGPPGTGKTFLIKALCGETDVHFINLIPAKLDQKYVGEGKEAFEKIWQEAEDNDKTIIFIDEIDGLPNRSDRNTSSVSANIVNTLLDKLDGFNRSDKKIVLMGATNNLDKIDTALRSRFSKEIYVGNLKNKEIEGYLKHSIVPYQISYHTFLSLQNIAQLCQEKNFSNRDLTTIIEEAYKKTAKWQIKNPQSHNVMLPSDLEEVLNLKLKNQLDFSKIKKRREVCEDQYSQWKEGFNQYLEKPKDESSIRIRYTFDGLNGINYYRQQYSRTQSELNNTNYQLTQINQENKIPQLEQELITLQQTPEKYEQTIKDKKQEIIDIKNKLQRLRTQEERLRKELQLCENRISTQPEPNNLAIYIKNLHPFDRWNEDGDTYDFTTLNGFDSADFDTKACSYLHYNIMFEKQQNEGPGDNKLILKYKGPKHLLNEDKDYYLGDAFVHDANFKLTHFHLHFNPVRKTLSIFKDKHNYDKIEEAKMKKRQDDDW